MHTKNTKREQSNISELSSTAPICVKEKEKAIN